MKGQNGWSIILSRLKRYNHSILPGVRTHCSAHVADQDFFWREKADDFLLQGFGIMKTSPLVKLSHVKSIAVFKSVTVNEGSLDIGRLTRYNLIRLTK